MVVQGHKPVHWIPNKIDPHRVEVANCPKVYEEDVFGPDHRPLISGSLGQSLADLNLFHDRQTVRDCCVRSCWQRQVWSDTIEIEIIAKRVNEK